MVGAPRDNRGSGSRANALGGDDPVVMLPHALCRGQVEAAEARRLAHRRLFEDAPGAELLQRVRDRANGGFVLGSPRFERQIGAVIGRRSGEGPPGRPRRATGLDHQKERGLWRTWFVRVLWSRLSARLYADGEA